MSRGVTHEGTKVKDGMRISEELRGKRQQVLVIAARHGAANVSVFGSGARGDDTVESDVDLLIDVVGQPTPWFPGGLIADLEELLGRPVHVVVRRSLSPLIRESVLRDALPL